jgi:quercetin dioxygenase-like cupin family protein
MALPFLVEPEPVPSQRMLYCTPEEAATLLAHLPAGAVERELPGSSEHAYLDRYIVKPWGHEIRVYDDRWLDVWRLSIEAGKGTSVHAHPRKDTCLICIEGEGAMSTGAGEEIPLVEGSVVHIGAGAVHASFSAVGMSLIEVETPRDKFDLVRIEDRFGRAGQPYEAVGESRREPCPLVAHAGGPPGARLRRHCATGCFRFNLESGARILRSPHDLVVAISLESSSVLRRELMVLGIDALTAVTHHELYLTVRSNHR